jgi:hypothetical protein
MACDGVSSRSARCALSTARRLPHRPITTLARTPSAPAHRDEQLKEQIARVHQDNYGVYGARRVWLELNRKGIPVARCTVERLMGELGLRGAAASCPPRAPSQDRQGSTAVTHATSHPCPQISISADRCLDRCPIFQAAMRVPFPQGDRVP